MALMTIAVFISNAFSVPLWNVTRTFQEILSRKKGSTLFIDSLKIALNQRIDDIEEKHVRRMKKTLAVILAISRISNKISFFQDLIRSIILKPKN